MAVWLQAQIEIFEKADSFLARIYRDLKVVAMTKEEEQSSSDS